MKTRFTVTLILILSGLSGGSARGQPFRFVPIPRRVPFRFPSRPPIHLPIHPPTSIPQDTDPSHPNDPPRNQAASGDISTIVLVCFGIALLAILAAIIAGVKEANPSIGLMSLILGLFGLLVGVFAVIKKSNPSGGLIRIISTPPGEAPQSIREAWVGLELPLVKTKDQGQELAVMGVLSWTPDFMNGYAVEGMVALEHLAAHSPEAAVWWRENVPYVLNPSYQFIFPLENCQKLG